VVTRKLLLVAVDQLVAWHHDERCAELGGSSTCLALAIAASKGSRTCKESIRSDQRSCAETVHLDDVGSLAVLVEQDRERNALVLDERIGVAFPACAESCHTSARCRDLFVSIADLTGPFATGCSAEVSEEQEHVGIFCPQISESMHPTGGVREGEISKSRCVERHRVLSVVNQSVLVLNIVSFIPRRAPVRRYAWSPLRDLR